MRPTKVYFTGFEGVTTQRLIIRPFESGKGNTRSMLVKNLDRAKKLVAHLLKCPNSLVDKFKPKVTYAIYYDNKGKRHVFINNLKKKEESNKAYNKYQGYGLE